MAVQLIIDAGCDISSEQANELGVVLIPMTIHFADAEYRAGMDITADEFYKRLAEVKELPTTSQPVPYDFARAYQAVKDKGDTAVVLCVSSALSGTYQSASIAAADYPGIIYVVDTQAVTVGQRLLLEYAITLKQSGCDAGRIAEAIARKKKDLRVFGAVDSLEYLIKGGRLSKAAGAVGTVLGIRPILSLSDGALVVAGKARGVKAAINMTHDFIRQAGIDLTMPYGLGYTGMDPTVLEPFLNAAGSVFQPDSTPIFQVGSTVGTHTGPGLFLAAFFKTPQA